MPNRRAGIGSLTAPPPNATCLWPCPGEGRGKDQLPDVEKKRMLIEKEILQVSNWSSVKNKKGENATANPYENGFNDLICQAIHRPCH